MSFLLLILVGLYFVFALWDARRAVLWLPLLIPTYLLSFELKGVPFTLMEAFIDVTFLAFILRFLYDWVGGTRNHGSAFKTRAEVFKFWRMRFDWRFWVPVLLMVLSAVIATLIVSKEVVMVDGRTIFYGQRVALGILKGWIITPVLLMVLFFLTVRAKNDFQQLLDMYASASIFLALWAFLQVVTQSFVTPDARASGPFNSANYLALFITPAILYVLVRLKELYTVKEPWLVMRWLAAFFRRRNLQEERLLSLQKIFWAVGLFLLLFALIFTKSYAAMMALLFAGFLYFGLEGARLHGLWRRFGWKWLVAVLAALAVVAFGVFWLDPKKWLVFFEFSQQTSSAVRVEIYTIATHLIAQHPWLGIGLGQFPLFYQLQGPQILGHDPYEWNMLHPHNFFFAVWLNLGLLGLVSFAAILAFVLSRVAGQLKRFMAGMSWGVAKMRIVALAMLIIMLVHGLFDTPFFKNDLSIFFWIVITVMVLPLNEEAV